MSTPGGYYSPFMAEPPRPTCMYVAETIKKKIVEKLELGLKLVCSSVQLSRN